MKWRYAFYAEELAVLEDLGIEYEIQEREFLNSKRMVLETQSVLYAIAPEENEVAIIHLINPRHSDTRFCIVHRCAKGIGGWQVTWFDEGGAYGDTLRSTLQEALDVARAIPGSSSSTYERFMLNEIR